ncbi:MAG: site-2 protease family protein [Christensenellaceae bacterium]|jgi:regulator of sigma E protease|nr:site-2 protease family protein [Christensenellaceae bacterium]
MMMFVYVLVAILTLLFMITVHEVGHYLAAKLLKFRVNEFAIGFGKAIFKHTNKKTGEIFSLRMFPLGGFCAFEGEGDAGSPGANKTATQTLEGPHVGKGGHRTTAVRFTPDGKPITPFNEMAPWKRLIVLFSGAFFNFICAVVFSIILVGAMGYYQQAKITKVDSASHLNGTLKTGDIVKEVNGKKFTFLNNFQSRIAPFKINEEFKMTIVRDGQTKQVTVKKAQIDPIDGERYWALGISSEVSFIKLGFGGAIEKGFVFSGELVWMMLKLLGQMATFKVSFSQMGGTFSTISVMGQAISTSWMTILILIPLISVNLAVVNLLPIPALDGARMVFVLIEWVRGKPVNPELENRIHMIGLFILFGFMILLDLNYLIFSRL